MNPRTRELIVGRPRCDGQPWSAHMLQSLMEHLMELTAHYGGDRGRTNRVTLARDLASVLLVLSLDMGQGGTA